MLDGEYEPFPGVRVNTYYMGGCPPTEIFGHDGRWEKSECQRAVRVYRGHWTVEVFQGGHRLCVEAVDFLKQCRFVWQGASADQLILSAPTPSPSGWGDAYNPYRILNGHPMPKG